MGFVGTTAGEIAKEISKTTPFSFDGLTKVLRYNADDVAKSFANRQGVAMGNELKSMKKALSGIKDVESKEYKALAEMVAKKSDQFSSVATAHKAGTADAINSAFKGITNKDTIGYKASLEGYFLDAKNGSMRRKAVAGGLAGAAVGKRMLSGGTMTHKANGEQDIAGVPFI